MSSTTNDELAAIRERMRSEGVRLVQVEVPDLDGGLRGKLLALDKGISDEIGWSRGSLMRSAGQTSSMG